MSNKVCVILRPEFHYNEEVIKLLTNVLLAKAKPKMFVADHITITKEDLISLNNSCIIKGLNCDFRNLFQHDDKLYMMFLECDRKEVLYALYSDSKEKQKIEKIFHNNRELYDFVFIFKKESSKILEDFHKSYVNKRAIASKSETTASV